MVTAVVMRHVLRRVKPAVRIRKEKELQSCHGVDQHASAGNPDLGLAVARVVLAGVVQLLLLLGVEGGGICAGRCGSRLLDLRLELFYGKIHESFLRFETSPVPPTLKLPDAAGWCPDIF